MDMDRYLDRITGPEFRFSLTDRILNAALFLSLVVGSFTISLDYFENAELRTKLISAGLYLVVFILYFLSRRTPGITGVKIVFLVFQFIGIIYIWYFFDGVSGISNVYIISFVFIITLITKGITRTVLLSLFFLIAFITFLIEMSHPDIVINYVNSKNENFDSFLTTIGIATGIIFMTLILVHSYTKKQKQVENLSRSKDMFLSIIAHDLKNPIATMTSLGEYLMNSDEQKNPESRKRIEKALYTTSKNTYTFLENILLWAKSETGMMAPELENLNICDAMNGTISFLREQANIKNISIVNEIDQHASVRADQNMFNLVTRNILSNAIKFTYMNGRILINAEQDPDTQMTTLQIKDNGIGIANHLIPTLFDLDCTYQRQGTNDEKGTGLGLKLCKEFIDKQNGKIWVESYPETGSSFFLSLPTV